MTFPPIESTAHPAFAVRAAGTRAGAMPYGKYLPFQPVDLPDRTWPDAVLDAPPRWCSVDLRDGDQALIDPMNVAEKLRMWDLLLDIGLKEIEVGFPSASQSDFDFIRRIVGEGRIPPDVTIQVICPARQDLIRRTVDALEGAPNVVFHLFNSTSTLERRVVFEMDRRSILDLAVDGTRVVRDGVSALSGTNIVLE